MKFRIVKTAGRTQPFAVWKGAELYRFFITEADAAQYIHLLTT